MSKKITLSKFVFDRLSKHFKDFTETQNKLLNDTEMVPAAERKTYQEIFMQYLQHLERLLKEAQITDSEDNSLPCVTFGSVVELENLENKRINKIFVTYPTANPPVDKKIKVSLTSYNSPVGKALFLKKPGDTVEVNAPGGKFKYRIKSVDLMIS
ncbi:MAG TPA: GreA/GreB family elongation factor [Syntrophomonas sp.]|nr:GreA/GreB family elongation factor [Syntrophomonas sp.]HRW12043.1 GreA/GreB family elongation factor [Syntrophomonas sp.]